MSDVGENKCGGCSLFLDTWVNKGRSCTYGHHKEEDGSIIQIGNCERTGILKMDNETACRFYKESKSGKQIFLIQVHKRR